MSGAAFNKRSFRSGWSELASHIGETCLEHNLGDQDCLFKNEQLLSALPLECHDARVAFLTPKFVPPQKMACVVHLAEGNRTHGVSRGWGSGGLASGGYKDT
nr:hypothetical protein CFP56_29827 [Quercus suber]